MKAKPPFQVLILDDNGREVFCAYLSPAADPHYDISTADPNDLLGAMRDAMQQPLLNDACKWFAN